MKKYARLRSTSCSFPAQCDGEEPEVDVSTTFVDSGASKWSSLKLSPPVHVTKQGHGDDRASCSSSHRVLADALKKLSSLRETQCDDNPLPRGVATTCPSWGYRIVRDSDAGGGSDQLHSTGFVSESIRKLVAGNDWPRPRSAMGSEFQSNSIRSSNGGAAAGSIVRTKTGCIHTSHLAHRRSSSMHDVATEARPCTSSIAAISGLEGPRQPAKLKGAGCFPDHVDSEQFSPSQLRTRSRLPVSVSASSPLQGNSCSLWEESEDPTLRKWSGRRVGAVQSLRYDRLQSAGLGADPGFKELESSAASTAPRELQSQSVREGAAHAQAIAAMAKAYAEKYGVAQAVVECVACGRGLGVIVEGNSPGSYDSSFCRSCRPPVQQLPGATAAASAPAPSSSSWKKLGVSRGMMHYCRKLLLRIGKKPGSHKYTMV